MLAEQVVVSKLELSKARPRIRFFRLLHPSLYISYNLHTRTKRIFPSPFRSPQFAPSLTHIIHIQISHPCGKVISTWMYGNTGPEAEFPQLLAVHVIRVTTFHCRKRKDETSSPNITSQSFFSKI